MKIELKNYSIIMGYMKCDYPTSVILNVLTFFRLKDDSNKEIYFRDPRYIDLEGPGNILCLKENDLLEFIDLNDMAITCTLQQLSDRICIYVCGRYISTINASSKSIFEINQDINRITEPYDTFIIEFEYSNEIIAQVFINRLNPESSYVVI